VFRSCEIRSSHPTVLVKHFKPKLNEKYFFLTANVTPFIVGFWSATNGAISGMMGPGTGTPGAQSQWPGAPGFNLMYTQVPC
jgi:hypothetical protein